MGQFLRRVSEEGAVSRILEMAPIFFVQGFHGWA